MLCIEYVTLRASNSYLMVYQLPFLKVLFEHPYLQEYNYGAGVGICTVTFLRSFVVMKIIGGGVMRIGLLCLVWTFW